MRRSRGASVVLAGAVGLAVLAPGLALASAPQLPPPPQPACATGTALDPPTGLCVPVPAPATGEALSDLPGDPNAAGGPSAAIQVPLAPPGVEPGDLPPPEAPDGDLRTPRDACAEVVGGLDVTGVPEEQRAALAEQFRAFCAGLPESFDPSGPDGPADLVEAPTALVASLPSLPAHDTDNGGGSTSGEVPTGMPAEYHGYYRTPGHDVDCGDVTGAQAEALTTVDGSDTFELDVDRDGTACETLTDLDQGDIGYPVGGVATGDGSSGGPAVSPAVLALAGLGVGGLALSGRILVCRHGTTG